MEDLNSLGDYTILKKLGFGAFGEVYLAEHKFIKKKYALKLLPEELSKDQSFLKRFDKDVSVLASLDHPSIVKVHNISYADGRYFLVTDCIIDSLDNSMDLESYLNQRGKFISEVEAETIIRQIASALDYAHRVKTTENSYLAHRGLKLSNVLIAQNDKGLRVYISDFGLSRIIGEGKVLKKGFEKALCELGDEDENDLEASSRFLRSFAFLAPEQKILQNRYGIDTRADIYSFGALVYYLITRQVPEGYFELPSKLAPEYKLNWDLLVCKCLQKDSNKRPNQLTEALNTYLTTEQQDISSIDVLSWAEVGKKVENAMQMSFEFSTDEPVEVEDKELLSKGKNIAQPKPIINPQEISRPTYEPDPGAIFQKELNVSFYQPQKVEIKEIEPLLTEMVIVRGGTYYRGSNEGSRDEMPRHKISVSSIALDIHPVTNEQFIRFLDAMGGEKDKDNNDIIRLKDSRINRSGGTVNIESGYAKHPVVGVTWYGANAYSKWIGKRLPSEAEWEIASRGGLDCIYPTGTDIDHTQANFFNSDTMSVMSYSPNRFGLFDMAGNVYEWIEDWYAYNYYDTSLQEPENPKGPQQGVYRVLRGGCWKSLKEDLRCSHRHRNNPGTVNGTYGFRCAAEVS
jgi:formylglycine-generating enzyme required for sulfatase activity